MKKTVVVIERENGWYVAIAGKHTKSEVGSQGRSIASALRNLAEAIEARR